MAATNTQEGGLPLPDRLILETAKRIAERTHSGEDILADAGVRLTATGTADLAQETNALEPGRYLVTFTGADANDICYLRQKASADDTAATSAACPMWHKDRRYLRVTGSANNKIAALFAASGAALNVVRSSERGEE